MKYNVEKMIAELCPTGVLYCEMGKLAQIGTGKSNGNEAEDNGEYPFFIRSPIVKRKNCYEYDEEVIIIPGEGGVGDIFHYINGKYALHQRVYRIHFTTKDVDTRFMYYYLSANFKVFIQRKAVNATVTSIRKPMIEQFPIPLPPLPIQQEIVRILDTFTNLTAELTNKLNAELTARRKQYEYYRDELLTFGEDVAWTTLKCIADIGTGSSNTNEGLKEGKYPFFVRSQEPLRKNEYEYDETAIITAGDGVGVGKVYHFYEGKYALHQRAYRIHVNTEAMYPKFVFHYMRAKFLPYIEKTMFHGSVSSIRRPMLNKFPIPVLKVCDQKQIADILDKFDKLCEDISEGIPAEISARQKQYEYYRNQLLTFKQIGG